MNFKENRGITLVALVVTIIVLLTLSVVTISMITGGDGIINKASEAKLSTEIQTEMEELQKVIIQSATKGISHGNFSGSADAITIRDALKKNNLIVENPDDVIIDGKNRWIVTGIKTGQKYKIKTDGSIEKYRGLLPSRFQQVEYLESTGTQYIDTRYHFNGGIAELEIKFSMSNVTPSLYRTNFVAASRENRQPRNYFLGIGVINTYGSTYLRATSGGTLIDNGLVIDETPTVKEVEDIKLILDENDKILTLLNNGVTSSMEYTGTAINSNNYILFGTNDLGNNINYSAIYKASIKENGLTIRDFIPCYCNTTVTDTNGKQCPSGTKGLYDLVTGDFYINQNESGADFTAGPEV